MSARHDLIDLLTPALPVDWDLYPYPATVDAIESGHTLVLVDTYAEQTEPIRGLRAHTITLVLAVPFTSSPEADDALDVAWDLLRPVLEDMAGSRLIHWNDATRSTFDSTYPAFTIPVTMKTKD
jgi:hypothetical protein